MLFKETQPVLPTPILGLRLFWTGKVGMLGWEWAKSAWLSISAMTWPSGSTGFMVPPVFGGPVAHSHDTIESLMMHSLLLSLRRKWNQVSLQHSLPQSVLSRSKIFNDPGIPLYVYIYIHTYYYCYYYYKYTIIIIQYKFVFFRNYNSYYYTIYIYISPHMILEEFSVS